MPKPELGKKYSDPALNNPEFWKAPTHDQEKQAAGQMWPKQEAMTEARSRNTQSAPDLMAPEMGKDKVKGKQIVKSAEIAAGKIQAEYEAREKIDPLNGVRAIMEKTAVTDDEKALLGKLIQFQEKWKQGFATAVKKARETKSDISFREVAQKMGLNALPLLRSYFEQDEHKDYLPTKEQFFKILDEIGFFTENKRVSQGNLGTFSSYHTQKNETMNTALPNLKLLRADPESLVILALLDEEALKNIYDQAEANN